MSGPELVVSLLVRIVRLVSFNSYAKGLKHSAAICYSKAAASHDPLANGLRCQGIATWRVVATHASILCSL